MAGTIPVRGAKNAATPIIAAAVLLKGTTTLHNVPRIGDVELILDILQGMGAQVTWTDEHSLTIDCDSLDPSKLDYKKVSKIRSSILLMGCLASRFGNVTISVPGGCQIGSRPLDAHLDAFADLGFTCVITDNLYTLEKATEPRSTLVMKEFSVTATENVILASVLGSGTVTVRCAASEPMVQDLCWFLRAAGASIDGIGTHTLSLKRVSGLHGIEYTIMPDYIEAGTFIVLAAATHSAIRITDAAPEFLSLELRKFEEIGMSFTFEDRRPSPHGAYELATIVPKKLHTIAAVKKVHTMPYPGFAADLIQPFALLMTQAQGISLVHDWMYDGRQRYVSELQKMGANINILDPHRILIVGPTPLYGKEITSYDLRAGATLVLASLIAEGQSIISNISQVDRGYEKLDERLRDLGASIERA